MSSVSSSVTLLAVSPCIDHNLAGIITTYSVLCVVFLCVTSLGMAAVLHSMEAQARATSEFSQLLSNQVNRPVVVHSRTAQPSRPSRLSGHDA